MKKFVIVMISLLVLFVFLMLNYLLWDKENLLAERNNDRITQDWLRGQNNALLSTVEELEQKIEDLESQINDKKEEIADLEQQVRSALERENKNIKDLQEKTEALEIYKTFMGDELKALTEQWFEEISKNRLEDSYNYLSVNHSLWGYNYGVNNYIEAMTEIQSLTIREDEENKEQDNFKIIAGQNEPYLIKTQILVNVVLRNSGNGNRIKMTEGPNTLEVSFSYDKDKAKWAINAVETIKAGKP